MTVPLPDDAVLAWHFVDATLRDGRPVPADGVVLSHEGAVVCGRSGYHGCRDPFDCLPYATGPTLCRVAIWGDVAERDDKLVGRHRVVLWRVDANDMLSAFARWCALQVIHLWDAPDVVRRYLETGDESLRAAAKDAAWAAEDARDAAKDAAWDAAWDAARDAAWDAAWAAAEDARDAAKDAAWDAAWDAAEDARDAAKDAAWDAQRKQFNSMLAELTGDRT